MVSVFCASKLVNGKISIAVSQHRMEKQNIRTRREVIKFKNNNNFQYPLISLALKQQKKKLFLSQHSNCMKMKNLDTESNIIRMHWNLVENWLCENIITMEYTNMI